ncbi:hypothetical protein AB0O38_16095 [Pseudarthrobacter oxydans]|uniref:hypothetical protein n=1 Tax=Pseudarthrobacter oxydans TaxID=1671 RepID=UPI00343BB3EF
MANDPLTDMQDAIEALEGAVIPIPDVEKQVKDIKAALEILSKVVTDLVQETSERPAEYAKDLQELDHVVRLI